MADDPVAFDQQLGRVVFQLRRIGRETFPVGQPRGELIENALGDPAQIGHFLGETIGRAVHAAQQRRLHLVEAGRAPQKALPVAHVDAHLRDRAGRVLHLVRLVADQQSERSR